MNKILFVTIILFVLVVVNVESKTITLGQNKDLKYEIVFLEKDKDLNIDIISFSKDFITVELSVSNNEVNKNIPVRIWELNESIEEFIGYYKLDYQINREYSLTFNNISDKQKIIYSFGVNKILEFGENSTTIKLQIANSENLEDTFVRSDSATTNYGDLLVLEIKGGVNQRRSYIKFNISSIPLLATITDSQLCLYKTSNGNTGSQGAYHTTNKTWIEEDLTWNNKPSFNLTQEDTVAGTSGAGIWVCWNVTQAVKRDYNVGDSNFSIELNSTESGTGIVEDIYVSKENGTVLYMPYLNITYDEYVKTDTKIDLYLNGTLGNVYYLNQSYANFTSVLNVTGKVNMTTNMTNWIDQLNKQSPYTNISQMICSNNNTYYNITSWFEENATHTSSSSSHYAICYVTVTTTTTTTTIPTTTTTIPTYECNYYFPYTYLNDTMVRQDDPNTNYGSSDYSYIGSNAFNGTQRNRYYIKFDISEIDNTISIISSSLCVNVRDVSSVGYPVIQSFWIINNTWLETELTWNNQLCGVDYGTVSGSNCNSTILDLSYGIADGYHCFNVTKAIEWEFSESENENVSFILMGTNQTEYNSTNINRWFVYAKEQYSYIITPYLIVNGTCGEPPTTTTTIPTTTTTIPTTTTTIEGTTTTTIILPYGNYTSYSCSGLILIKNVTNVINETYSNSIYEYTNCEFGCSSYLGRARCEPEDFIIWILFAIIFIGIIIMIKTFMRYKA